ncbi:hypothetical protein CSQ85_12125 [Bifidobacterium rousetti]|nr:hypothetical protein CSQ85_12125 [Bifidobacterium rousetti]
MPQEPMESLEPMEPSYELSDEERAARRARRAGRSGRMTPKFVGQAVESDTAQSSPLVSVIVTVHDAAETVRFCVDSILRQSYANLEVILVDDGSNDDSSAILREYEHRDDRVTTIFLNGRVSERDDAGSGGQNAHNANDVASAGADAAGDVSAADTDAPTASDAIDDAAAENGDVAARARNAGLDAAHGEYVMFAGSDGILDRRGVELLLHALIRTGADMAKSRRERFTADQLYTAAEAAVEGAREPETVTVFTDALEAYQSVFLRSVRVIGDEFGRNTESRYLDDEDWGRLYRAAIWDGVRLPEGIYSPELLAAGELYSRMGKVADVDAVLYRLRDADDADERWELGGRPDDDTAADDTTSRNGNRKQPQRRFRYYHDRFTAGTANFRFALERGILPARSYYTMVTAYEGAKSAPDFDEPEHREQFALDTAELEELRGKLSVGQRIRCMGVKQMRLFEQRARKLLPATMSQSRYMPEAAGATETEARQEPRTE